MSCAEWWLEIVCLCVTSQAVLVCVVLLFVRVLLFVCLK